MNKVNFQPIGYYILTEAPKVEEKTKAGVIKPKSLIEDEKKNSANFLKVLAVGDDVKNIEVGNLILAAKGDIFSLDGVDYLLTQLTHIKGKRVE